MTSEKAPELKGRLDMLSEGATPGPYGVESYGSGTTYVTLGTWPGHYASDTVPPMGYGRAEIVTTNIPRAWGEVGRKSSTAHFLTELANAYRAGKLVTTDVADAMVAAVAAKATETISDIEAPSDLAFDFYEGTSAAYEAVLALTPADARAALAEAERKAWNAAIEAAHREGLDKQGRRLFGEGRQNAAYDIGVSDTCEAIAALKKEPEA